MGDGAAWPMRLCMSNGRMQVEKAQDAIKEEDAARLMRRMLSAKFDFNDFLQQYRTINKMGAFGNVMKMIPGMNKIDDKDLEQVERKYDVYEKIITVRCCTVLLPHRASAGRPSRLCQRPSAARAPRWCLPDGAAVQGGVPMACYFVQAGTSPHSSVTTRRNASKRVRLQMRAMRCGSDLLGCEVAAARVRAHACGRPSQFPPAHVLVPGCLEAVSRLSR